MSEISTLSSPVVDQFISNGVTRHTLHDVTLGLFVGEGDGWDHVGSKVDTEDGDGAKRQRNVCNDEEKEGGYLRDIARQRISD